jgi:hypothetical protein
MIPKLIDQVGQGLGRNIDFLDKENFNKLIKLFLEEVQELEVATLSVADQKNINTAIGVWLDYIGNIVGEVRRGRNDTDYRAALLLKIAINSSDGTPNTIIDITKQYTGATNSRIIEYFTAYLFNILQLPESTPYTGIADLVDTIKPAGVGIVVVDNTDGNRFVPAWVDLGDNYTNTEYAYLDWVELTPFEVFTGGGLQPLQLHDMSYLEVATSTNVNINATEGLLAQVIV